MILNCFCIRKKITCHIKSILNFLTVFVLGVQNFDAPKNQYTAVKIDLNCPLQMRRNAFFDLVCPTSSMYQISSHPQQISGITTKFCGLII